MKQISNKEYLKYLEYKKATICGRILTPDGLKLICQSYNNDPTEIGKHLLQTLHRIEQKSAFSKNSIF